MNNSYYIITSESNKSVYCTDNIGTAYDFILENQDARFRTVNHTAKPKIMNRELFLKRFYEFTKDKHKFFALATIIIRQRPNLSNFLSMEGLLEEYNQFKKEFL